MGGAVAVSVASGVLVASGVSVAIGVLVGGAGVGVGATVEVGAIVGVAGSAASRLALSQYISLCLLAKSGFVRMKTVIVLFSAVASNDIQPHWSMTPDIGASPDQTTVGALGFQLPVGSIPIWRWGLAGRTD